MRREKERRMLEDRRGHLKMHKQERWSEKAPEVSNLSYIHVSGWAFALDVISFCSEVKGREQATKSIPLPSMFFHKLEWDSPAGTARSQPQKPEVSTVQIMGSHFQHALELQELP